MQTDGLAKALRDRHLEYYLGVVETHHAATVRETDLAVLEPHYDNIRAALRWALETGRHPEALRMCAGLIVFWNVYQRFRDGMAFLDDVLAPPGGDPVLRAQATYGRADLLVSLGRAAEALPGYEAASAALAEAGETFWQVRAEIGVAWALWYAGKVEEAAERIAPILGRLDSIDDPIQQVRVLELEGWAATNLGDRDRARAAFDRATAIAERSGDPIHVAEHLGVKASALSVLRLYDDSEIARQRAVDLYLAHAPDARTLAWDLQCLADLRARRGEDQQAEAAFRQALALIAGRDPVGEALIRSRIAGYHVMRGDLDAGRVLLIEAKELYERASELSADAQWERVGVDSSLAEIAYEQGDVAEAERRMERCATAVDGLYDGTTVWPGAIQILASAAENRGDADAAARYWTRLAETPIQSYERDGQNLRILASATAARLRGGSTTARRMLGEALERSRASGDVAFESQCTYELARLDLDEGRVEDARAGFDRALGITRAHDFRAGRVRCATALASLYLSSGDTAEARALEGDLASWERIRDPLERASYAVVRAHLTADADPETAVRLLAAADGIRAKSGYRARAGDLDPAALVASLRTGLGDRFDALWRESSAELVQAILHQAFAPQRSRTVT